MMDDDRISRAASAAEQLCGALWEAVHEEMRAGRALEVVALTDRIAEVCRSVSAVANAGGAPPRGEQGQRQSEGLSGRPSSPSTGFELRHARGAAGNGEPVLGGESRAGGTSPRNGPRAEGAPIEAEIDGPFDLGDRPAALVDEHEGVATPIAIRDVRGAEGTAWADAIGRRLDRYADDRVPFAVLLVEVLDLERLRVAEGPGEAHRQIREVEGAIVEQLRPADALLREADGRYWLIAPQTEGAVAAALAQRIASAARRSASHRGASLQVSLGIALCPDDGVDAATLIAHADVDLFAAQAEGRRFGAEDDRPLA